MSETDDTKRIRELMTHRLAAVQSRDVDALMARYLPGVVHFDLAPPLVSVDRPVADPAGLRRWFDGFEGPIDYEIRQLVVVCGSDVAFSHSVNRMSAVPTGGRTFSLWFRSTVGWQRSDDDWFIGHEHSSVPFHMDGSLRAAVDLTP